MCGMGLAFQERGPLEDRPVNDAVWAIVNGDAQPRRLSQALRRALDVAWWLSWAIQIYVRRIIARVIAGVLALAAMELAGSAAYFLRVIVDNRHSWELHHTSLTVLTRAAQMSAKWQVTRSWIPLILGITLALLPYAEVWVTRIMLCASFLFGYFAVDLPAMSRMHAWPIITRYISESSGLLVTSLFVAAIIICPVLFVIARHIISRSKLLVRLTARGPGYRSARPPRRLLALPVTSVVLLVCAWAVLAMRSARLLFLTSASIPTATLGEQLAIFLSVVLISALICLPIDPRPALFVAVLSFAPLLIILPRSYGSFLLITSSHFSVGAFWTAAVIYVAAAALGSCLIGSCLRWPKYGRDMVSGLVMTVGLGARV